MDEFEGEDVTIDVNLGVLRQEEGPPTSENSIRFSFRVKPKEAPMLWITCSNSKSRRSFHFMMLAEEFAALKQIMEKADKLFRKAGRSTLE
jgi:hypothetical protein